MEPVAGDAPFSGTPDTSEVTAPLSKSAQKRLAKSERFAQIKLERRAREKEEKAAKRKEREEREAAGEDAGPPEAKKRRVTREGQGPVRPFDARIVIDLGFDEKMTEKVSLDIRTWVYRFELPSFRKSQACVANSRTRMRPIGELEHRSLVCYSLLSMAAR